MSEHRGYTPFHPRWYRPRISTWWWLGSRRNLLFILRELSSIFVAWSAVFLLGLVRAIHGGGSQYSAFLDRAARPPILVLNLITLVFVLLHAITWFNLASQALYVRVLGKRVPGAWIAGANYVAWMAASALVVWVLLRKIGG